MSIPMKNDVLINSSLYLTGALIFMLFAFYNGYPVISGDTAVYITSGFRAEVPAERPIFYGLFIRLSSLMTTAWATVFVQCFILSYLCVRFIRSIFKDISWQHIIALLLLISLGTIASWYAGQLLPDIFTPILFLAIYLYVRQPNSKWDSFWLLLIIYVSIVMHYSNVMIATLLTISLIILSIVNKKWFRQYRKKAISLLGFSALGWFSMFFSNYVGGNGFVSSKASHVFLMGKLTESGVLKNYLEKNCADKNYKICNYKDDLPYVAWEFVWDQEHSPVFKTGGWYANKQEYAAIIRDIITSPRFWPLLAFKAVEATFRQIIQLNIDEGEERPWIKFEKGDYVYNAFNEAFPHETNQLMSAKQNLKTLNLVFYDEVYVVVLLLSILMMLFFTGAKHKQEVYQVYTILILFLFINAFVTANFGNVLTRLNSRAIWLLPMTNIVFIYRYFIIRERRTANNY